MRCAAKFEKVWGVTIPPKGLAPSGMFEEQWKVAVDIALYVIGENPLQSEADQHHARHKIAEGLDFAVVQDMLLTKDGRAGGRGFPGRCGVVRVRGHRD